MHPGLKLLHALEEGLVDETVSDVQRIEKECGGTPQANPAERVLEEDCLKRVRDPASGLPAGRIAIFDDVQVSNRPLEPASARSRRTQRCVGSASVDRWRA